MLKKGYRVRPTIPLAFLFVRNEIELLQEIRDQKAAKISGS